VSNEKKVWIDPPGVFIKLELEARGWSQRDLAFIVGQQEQQLTPLLTGKRAISPDVARLLAAAFDISPEFFLNLQSQFDLANAKTPDPAVKTRANLQGQFPVREMVRRGWIKDGEASLLNLQIERFFETPNVDGVQFAAKKTNYEEVSPSQLAWVYRVRQLARSFKLPQYSEANLRKSLEKLRSLMIDPEAVSAVPSILAGCGVRLVIVEALPSAKIDGVCTWLDDSTPVIGLSTSHDRMDNFWFVLRHEIEHVLCGHGKGAIGKVDFALTSENVDEQDDEEIVANQAARDFCIPSDKFDSFYTRKFPYFSERDVLGFAALHNIHPSLVVGQLQRRMGRYDYLRKYQIPLRGYVLPKAVADGWGHVVATEL
jgi:HTH-type transcriptional regulator / antitoxin HigA